MNVETNAKMLKPLLLPQLVEQRRKRESLQELDTDMDVSSQLYNARNSSGSDIASPVTPTFSTRSHLRYSSSGSSIEIAFQTPNIDSPASPTFNVLKTGKRSLPDVQEEPQERDEREESFDSFESRNDYDGLYDCFCDDRQCGHRDSAMAQSSVQLSSRPDFDYDLNDGFFSDGEVGVSPRFKKRREGESPFSAMATRIGERFPSFSRKWRLRKDSSPMMIISDKQRETTTISRSASSRSSSVSDSTRNGVEQQSIPQLPPTPTKSEFDDNFISPIDIQRANNDALNREEQLASTPLLPPLMIDASANAFQAAIQSPLQSPSVAEPNDPFGTFSGSQTTIDGVATPQIPGMPSPPLSTKPSISSFHRVNFARAGHLVPSSEIPPIHIAEENDEWAMKLGHANFTVQPEPYLPKVFDIEACRQLRADWDLARLNYTKHLVRTGEHYGNTSKTYRLTEEKWAHTDAIWKRNNDTTIQHTVDGDGDAFLTLKHTKFGGDSANIMTKIPSLNDPQSQGKFPQLGDEDIVGPMTQVAAQLQRSPSKKTKIMRFFAEKFPVGLGR